MMNCCNCYRTNGKSNDCYNKGCISNYRNCSLCYVCYSVLYRRLTEEKKILLKTIEALNATISSLSSTNQQQAEQLRSLQERVKELTAQVAWLNRQLFGRKSEKIAPLDPNQLNLFSEQIPDSAPEIMEARDK